MSISFLNAEVWLLVMNYYRNEDEEPVSVRLASPGEYGDFPVIKEVTLKRGTAEGKGTITIVLDRDAPPHLTAWHHLDFRVFRMKRRGSRIFFREHRSRKKQDHKVVLRFGEEWLSPPAGVTPQALEEEDEDDDEG